MNLDSSNSIVQKFSNLNIWKRHDERAPHKPLLALWAIGRCLNGYQRLVSFRAAEPELQNLLYEYGPPGTHRKDPSYPFWHMRNDGVWVVPETETLNNLNKHPGRVWLRDFAHGGFTPEVQVAFTNNPVLALEVAQSLLFQHFPVSYHDQILVSVGIKFDSHVLRRIKRRDPQFSGKVLDAYGNRCAVCRLAISFKSKAVALEAAHIKWFSQNGPNTIPNGLALCPLHHSLFDFGAFTVTEDMQLSVSKQFGGIGYDTALRNFDSSPIFLPEHARDYPNPEFLRWHQTQVFRQDGIR